MLQYLVINIDGPNGCTICPPVIEMDWNALYLFMSIYEFWQIV